MQHPDTNATIPDRNFHHNLRQKGPAGGSTKWRAKPPLVIRRSRHPVLGVPLQGLLRVMDHTIPRPETRPMERRTQTLDIGRVHPRGHTTIQRVRQRPNQRYTRHDTLHQTLPAGAHRAGDHPEPRRTQPHHPSRTFKYFVYYRTRPHGESSHKL